MLKKYDKILFYLTIFILTIITAFIFIKIDPDLFSRLIQGKYVYLHHQPMFEDIVSYTKTKVWFDHEWLISYIFYIISQAFGLYGLLFVKGLIYFLCTVGIVLAVKETSKHTYPYNLEYYLFFLYGICSMGLMANTIRCQSLSFAIFAYWILILEMARNNKNKALYFTPLIMLFWLNCHGAALFGHAMLGAYFIGEALNKKPFMKYFYALIACTLVLFINPWGIDYFRYLYEAFFVIRTMIAEWQSSFGPLLISLFVYKTYFFSIIVLFIYKLIKYKCNYFLFDKTKILVILPLMYESAVHIKYDAFFMIAYAIYFYEDIYDIFKLIFSKVKQVYIEKIVLVKNIVVYLLGYVLAVFLVFKINVPIATYLNLADRYPINAMNFAIANGYKGNILAHYWLSGFIAYKYYPEYKIFMDGRQEQLYPQEYILSSMDLFSGFSPMVLDRAKHDMILVENDWQINLHEIDLYRMFDFTKVYKDDRHTLYVKKDMVKKQQVYPKKFDESYYKELFKSNILE